MTRWRLLLRNLLYHRRGNSAVLLGVVVGTMVLTGALLVGDSLRGSLRDLTLRRLGWIDESLTALENDHEFLLKGDVFSTSMIERWITYKREKEIAPLRMRPHPLEFSMYFDV